MTEPNLRQLIDETLARVDGAAPRRLPEAVIRLCEIAGSVEPRQIWFTLSPGVEVVWSLRGGDPLGRDDRALLEAQPMDVEIRCHVHLRPPIVPGPLDRSSAAVQSIIHLEVADSELLTSGGLSMAEVGVRVWRVLMAASRLRVGVR